MAQFFTTREVAQITGVPYRTLDAWLRDGVAPCEIEARGTGTSRFFTFRDAVLVAVVKALRENNLPLDKIREGVEKARAGWTTDNPDDAGELVIFHGASNVVHWGKRIDQPWTMTPSPGNGPVLFGGYVRIWHLARDIQHRIQELSTDGGKPQPCYR